MGPLRSLLRWGAHVIAVDLPRPDIWQRVIAVARNSSGRLSIPVPVTSALPDVVTSNQDEELARTAGIDIIKQLPELYSWLSAIDHSYILGNYTYADGATHLRLGLATDVLAANLTRERTDIGLAFLATPTDVYTELRVSQETSAMASHCGSKKWDVGITQRRTSNSHAIRREESGTRGGLRRCSSFWRRSLRTINLKHDHGRTARPRPSSNELMCARRCAA